jgi:WD40 repeat protein
MPNRYLPLLLLCVSGVLGAEPARDRYGNPLPEGAIARLGSLRLRNEEFIHAAAFTADGKKLAAVGAGSTSFWDPVTGKLARRVEYKSAPQTKRYLCGDGETIVLSSNFDTVLRFVDASSGAEKATLNYGQAGFIQSLDLSRDGKILAAIHQYSISLWDVAGGKLLHTFKGAPISPLPPQSLVAVAPDGKQVVLPHADGSLHLVDVATGKELRAVEMPPPRAGVPVWRRLQRLIFSPDGRYLAFGGPSLPLTVCEAATGKLLHELAPPQGNYYTGAAFTPDSRLLAVDELTGIHLFDLRSGKEVRKLPLSARSRSILAFSPDGRTLAAVGDYTIKLWDMAAERWLHPHIGHEVRIDSLAFFPDGKRLVSADINGEMRVWDIASAQTRAQRTSSTPAVSLTVDRDGESVRFAGHDTSVHHWDVRSGRDEIQQKVVAALITNMQALSPDGRSLAVLAPNGSAQPDRSAAWQQLRLVDVKSNQAIVLRGLPEQRGIFRLLFTPDSRRLAAYFQDGAVRLWDRDTGRLVRELTSAAPSGQPMHLTFAVDGRSFLAWIGNRVRLREVSTGADRLQIPPLPGLVALAYAPDARLFACGQEDGRTLIYSAVRGKQLAQGHGKQGPVGALAFSPDGRLLASGGANGTILVWKMPHEKPLPATQNADEADSLWQALGESDPAAAHRAMAGLAAAPAQALPLCKERLRPLSKPLDRAQLAQWIAALDDDSFTVRKQAARELALAGDDAADALRQALHNSPSAESKRQMENLLARLEKGGDPERLRFVRALEVLERIGSPQAKEVLRALAGKPLTADLREEVQASLRRLGDTP